MARVFKLRRNGMVERVSSGLMNVSAILPYLQYRQQAAIALGKEEHEVGRK
jgi:hypothetical protein